MGFIRNLSIRQKLMFALTGTCAMALILCVAAIAAFEYISYQERVASVLESKADILSTLLGAGMEFGDHERANELLGKLAAIPAMESALLLDSSAARFASYRRNKDTQFGAVKSEDGVIAESDGATLNRTVYSGEGEPVGKLILRANYSDLQQRLSRQSKVLGGLLVALVLVASVLTWLLQRFITEPIVALAKVSDRSTAGKDYEERVQNDSSDEIGQLTSAFNRMVDNLQDREKALRASEERFRTFMDNNPAAAFLKNAEGAYVYCNNGFLKKSGRTSQQVLGRNDTEIWPARTAQKFNENTSGLQLDKPAITVEEVDLYSGKREWWTLIQFLIEEASGERLTGGIGLDITSLKEAEQIHKLNEELERRVARRTEQLEMKNQELESFSYSVSHDLRAPLRNLGGFIELLAGELGEKTGEDPARYMQIIKEEASRMGQLIDDLLLFSRLGRADMIMNAVDLDTLAREACDGMRHDLEGRKIEWIITGLPNVKGDRNLLRQVYANLIGNAVKFTRERDPAVIEIGALPHADGENGNTLFVKDNGAGFNEKYMDKLFGVFQRLHSTKQFEGTGIGLANVKTIIERHEGRVWAKGEEGKGAAFYFTMPTKQAKSR